VSRLGLPAGLGVVLLAAGFAFLTAILQPLEARRAALLEDAHKAAKRRMQSGQMLIAVSAPQAKLATFYGFFERDTPVTDHLATLYALAQRSGVEPRSAEYRLAESRTLRLAEYSVTMPLRGTYGEIRAFLENALGEIPVLTLDHVSVRRNRVAEHRVEAEVRFTLFLARR